MKHLEAVKPVLSVQGISVGKPRRLHDASFQLGQGEFVALCGPNGSGKSTLLQSIVGGIARQSGHIELLGQDSASYSARQRAQILGYVPQESSVPFAFRAHELIALGGSLDNVWARDAIEMFHVKPLLDRSLTTLSGGERQRVALVRAFAQHPSLLLLDEPTAHLDLRYQLGLFQLIERWCNRASGSALVAIHDLSQAYVVAHRVILLESGRIVAEGSPPDVLSPERLRSVYGVAYDPQRCAGGLFDTAVGSELASGDHDIRVS